MALPRWSLFFGKKRGERRTGSTALGRAALALFSAGSFTAGIISLAFILLKLTIPEWRVNHQFVPTKCQVLSVRVAADAAGLKRPEIEVDYTINDRPRRAWSHYDIAGAYSQVDEATVEKTLSEFKPGTVCDCWYDPREPGTVVLVRGYTWFTWLMLLLPASFIFLGGGGLLLAVLTWGKSTERIAATAPNASSLDLILPTPGTGTQLFPSVPDPQDLNDSPGTFLKYRLTPGTGGWTTAAIAVVCALWNLAAIVFARSAVESFRSGEPDWWLTILVVLLGPLGILLLVVLGRRMFMAASIGPTLVEISAHPLIPGGGYEIYMSQAGRMAVQELRLKLVCEEVALYRQGTNTRKTVRRVFEQTLVARESFQIGQGLPFEARCRLQVPYDAMHSFKSTHNRIDWKLVASGKVARWPDFERAFPVVIRPRQVAGAAS
ncbi:MAG: DUF3592 domain-containing protein [Singulisphaera sp.]